jgi:hypothetical protein
MKMRAGRPRSLLIWCENRRQISARFLWPEAFWGEDGVGERVMLWPVCLCGDFGDDAGDDGFREGGIHMEVSDHGCDIDRGFVGLPTVIIRDEAHRCESDFRFAAEPGFGCVGHADEIEAHRAVHVRFGTSRESRAVHGNVGSAVVETHGVKGGGFDEKFTHRIAVRIAKGNMGSDAVSEK